ncbi:hypothetical protein BB542_20080 [Escherichia coli]|nr:hypothetical protein [Salmonella enterica]EAR5397785.1 hypothetical protein [Salmonella enterica subsp. enterica serovar Mbandaka]EAS5434947.1 hypothetical protein [Salmonella enterica subsp. enterica serovar Alachua]EEY1621105.1 hypothetical protein [Escherichia coli]EAN4482622.1 hypothetical protein [Salmonella enterica]
MAIQSSFLISQLKNHWFYAVIKIIFCKFVSMQTLNNKEDYIKKVSFMDLSGAVFSDDYFLSGLS